MMQEFDCEDSCITLSKSQAEGGWLTIGAMVDDVNQGTTKRGSPYVIITLSDRTDTYRLVLFDEDYIKYSKYCTIGYYLLIKGGFEPKYHNSKETEFKVKKIHLLPSVREMFKKILIDSITKRIMDARGKTI